MPTYAVMFKLAPSPSRNRRERTLYDRLAPGTWWAETGSAMVVADDAPIDDFCDRLLSPDVFNAAADIAVVFDLEGGEARARGSFLDFGLFHLAPWIEKT